MQDVVEIPNISSAPVIATVPCHPGGKSSFPHIVGGQEINITRSDPPPIFFLDAVFD